MLTLVSSDCRTTAALQSRTYLRDGLGQRVLAQVVSKRDRSAYVPAPAEQSFEAQLKLGQIDQAAIRLQVDEQINLAQYSASSPATDPNNLTLLPTHRFRVRARPRAPVQADASGGLTADPGFLLRIKQRCHQVRLEGSDASSDSYCFR